MKLFNNTSPLLITTLMVTSLTAVSAIATPMVNTDRTMVPFDQQHQGQAHLKAKNKMQGKHQKMMKKHFMQYGKTVAINE